MKNIDTRQLDAATEAVAESLKNILNEAITNNDVRMQSLVSINFGSDDGQSIYGKGLVWTDGAESKQFIYRGNPDRIWTTESIDLDENQSFMIGNVPVLSANELGKTIRNSSLTKVGVLQNLKTQGNLSIDDTIFYNSDMQSLGIGTDAPKGTFNIVSFENDFMIDLENSVSRIGNHNYSDLQLITDNSPRITISGSGHTALHGTVNVETKLGVGVNTVPADIDLAVAGPISFQGSKFIRNSEIPTVGSYKKGDIVWNSNPQPTGYIGWVCIQDGTPGEWKPFGQISS